MLKALSVYPNKKTLYTVLSVSNYLIYVKIIGYDNSDQKDKNTKNTSHDKC